MEDNSIIMLQSIQQKYFDTEEDNNIDLLQNIIYGY